MKKKIKLKHILPLAFLPLFIPFNGTRDDSVLIDKNAIQKIINITTEINEDLKAPVVLKKQFDSPRYPKQALKLKQDRVQNFTKSDESKTVAEKKVSKVTKNKFKKTENLIWKKVADSKDVLILKAAAPIVVKGIEIKVAKTESWSAHFDLKIAEISKKLKSVDEEKEISEDKVSTLLAKNISMDLPEIDIPKKVQANISEVDEVSEMKKAPSKMKKIKDQRVAKIAKKNKAIVQKIEIKEEVVISDNIKTEEEEAVVKTSPNRTPAELKKPEVVTVQNEYPRAQISTSSFEEVLATHPVFMDSQKEDSKLAVTKNVTTQKKENKKSNMSSLPPVKVSKRVEASPVTEHLVASNDRASAQAEKQAETQTPAMQKALEEFVRVPEKTKKNQDIIKVVKKGTYKSNLSIKAYEVALDEGAGDYIENFEVQRLYDDNSLPMDSRHGSVTIAETLASKTGTALITLRKLGFYKTKFQALLEEGTFAMNIPFFERDAFDKFMGTQKIEGTGGYILIEMDDRTKSVELHDSKYFTNFFLNEDFKQVKENEPAAFVLFAVVEPGNALLSYETKSGEKIDKIIHVGEEEVLFEVNSYREKDLDTLRFQETEIFGKASAEFKLLPKHMTAFNSSQKPIQIGPARFEFRWPKADLAFRNYIEFSHLADNIYVGYQENKNIEIPTNDFVAHVFKQFELDSIENRCLTQINLSNRPLETSVGAFTHNGPMNYKILYQDRNGKFYDEISEKTGKIFVLGEFQGMINATVKYKNGGKDFITTPCSDDTYLVEQL